ncbi:MAG: hypothetical protein ABI614_19350 [Planctomycetota bacterium]
MKKLGIVLAVVAIFLALGTLLVSLVTLAGLGVGWCLHWLVPTIDLGAATICGLLACLTVIYAVLRIAQLLTPTLSVPSSDDGDDDEEYDEVFSEEQVEYVADQLAEAVLAKMGRKQTNYGGPARYKR